MTTHLKAPSGTGFLTLCKDFEPSCQLTDDIGKVDCPECKHTFWDQYRGNVKEALRYTDDVTRAAVKQDHVDVYPSTFDLQDPNKTQVGGDHYTVLDVQPWDAMASWVSPIEFEGFLRCNAIKYLARAGSKGPAVEDIKKARHYLDKLIEVMST